MIRKILSALAAIFILTAAYVYFFMYNKSHPNYENMKADMTISAQELYEDCYQNENATKYTGKLLEITGVPDALEINDSIYTLVFVFNDGMFGPEGVRASILPHLQQQINPEKINEIQKIKAFCSGYNGTDVILEKASLLP